MHVARRVEEVNAAEAVAQVFRGNASASWLIDRPEVLLAKMVCSPR